MKPKNKHNISSKEWEFPLFVSGQPLDWPAMEARFSWFRDMKGVPQDPIWHAEGDVFVHTKMVVEALVGLPGFEALPVVEQHVLFAAAMLHDVEKRSTTTEETIDGKVRIVAPRHAKKGEYTARTLLYREIPTPFELREAVAKLVRLHGLPLWAIHKQDPAKEVIRASQVVNTQHVAMLARADVLGRICEDQEELLLSIDLFEELCRENDCWGKARQFSSDYARYWYFNRGDSGPDYEPFDDLKFEVVMLSGLSGSGKDTYIKTHLDLPVLSLDEIRRELGIAPTDKKGNGKVIQLGKEKAREWMRKRQSFVFNATNITADMRSRWISLFTEYGGRVKIVYLEVPYQKLISQNHNRQYKVPEQVVEKMIGKLEIPAPYEAHHVEYQTGGAQPW